MLGRLPVPFELRLGEVENRHVGAEQADRAGACRRGAEALQSRTSHELPESGTPAGLVTSACDLRTRARLTRLG